MSLILNKDFYARPALTVATELLGKFLVKRDGDIETAIMIQEVEVYDGLEDRASHAYRGKTSRNTVMFGPAGFWYVYLIYGMYWMLNIVTSEENYPSAILIRGAGDFDGPGKLTKGIKIDKSLNGKKAIPETGLWIEDRGLGSNLKIKKTKRIGVDYAGEIWSKKLYRFVIEK